MRQEVLKNFMTNTDHTGRFIVYSPRTGVRYFVEPTGDPHRSWGDVNPATKELEGSYGSKYRGSIDEKDSLITPENGFKHITMLEPGMSPHAWIEWKDAQYPDKVK